MPQTPKDKAKSDQPEKQPEDRSYYYDDAHGYKDYEPNEEAYEDDAEDESEESA